MPFQKGKAVKTIKSGRSGKTVHRTDLNIERRGRRFKSSSPAAMPLGKDYEWHVSCMRFKHLIRFHDPLTLDVL